MVEKMFKNKKKPDLREKNNVKAVPSVNTSLKSTQEWIPIFDINNSTIYRKDGYIIAAINIEPINIDLLSEKERRRIIAAAHEAFNGLQSHIQIFSIGRPVDLDGYIKEQNRIKEEAQDMIRKRLINGYIKQAAEMAAGGEVTERKFYILMASKGIKSHDELLNKIKELASNLQSSGLNSRLCTDQELININFMFMNPAQAAFERGPITSGPYIPSQLEGDFYE